MPWTVEDVDRFKSGLTDAQKRRWVRIANSALRSCLANGGARSSCEASAIRQANGVVGNQTNSMKSLFTYDQQQPDYQVQEQGPWLIVPVVMMTEGVRHGSGGPILHLEDHYSENPEAWDGVPVTAGHPVNADGEHVSVNNVSQDQWIVGHLRNSRVEDGKLKADVYIHRQRAIAINPEVINYITEGKKLEVSIGAFTNDQHISGTYGDRQYEAITVDYQPDHLALLPGEEGACSWSDGCGIRINKQGDTMDEYLQSLKEAIREGKNVKNSLQDNQTGFIELSQTIQAMLDRLDSEARIHFLKEIFDDSFIYKVRDRDAGTERFFQQEYSVNADGEVTFEGDPQEVRMNVEFVPLQSNQDVSDEEDEAGAVKTNCGMRRTKQPNNNNNNKDSDMKTNDKGDRPTSGVMKRVVSLVNNERTRFTDSDQDWLLQLDEAQLEKLEPTEAPEAEVTREQAVQALQEDLQDLEKVKELLPEDIREKVETGLATHEATREQLIDAIQSNTSKEDWPEDTLKAMETENLQRLAKSVKAVDYSGQGPVTNSNGKASEEVLLPVGVGKKE